MLTKYLLKSVRYYQVSKRIATDGPLPQMLQYHLNNDQGQAISFWLDIPLKLTQESVTCVIEIPKQKHAKFEVKKHIENHPMMQDTRNNLFDKKLELRYYAQFPLFNYGFIPQTWEQNIRKDQQGFLGDDDPIDICDVSRKVRMPGEVFTGIICGSFCLIDQGEVDWKVLVVDAQQAANLPRKGEYLSNFDQKLLKSIQNWFKIVKVFDGKKANTILDGDAWHGVGVTVEMIRQSHRQWRDLVTSGDEKMREKRDKHRIKKMDVQDIIC